MARNKIQFGTAVEEFGTLTRGTIHLLTLPTAIEVNLPVIIASGAQDGPTFLLTANIHGDEVNPVIVVHRFLESLTLTSMKGRIVVIPSLNPTGHQAGTRTPLFQNKDPNRCWPEYKPTSEPTTDSADWLHDLQKKIDDNEGTQVRCFAKLAEVIKELKADVHVDLHTFSTLSLPFVFMDRILYNDKGGETKEQAQALLDRTNDFVSSIGLTVLAEQPAWLYVKNKLHRSTSAWTLNSLKIPSCTIELGPMHVAEPGARDAGVNALHNVCAWVGMTDGKYKAITSCPVLKFPERHRYLVYPTANATGIVDVQKKVSEQFKVGDTLAIIRHLDGRVLDTVVAEIPGYIIAWSQGIAKNVGDNLGMVAVEDKNLSQIYAWSEIPKD